jgi:hypothetical protein
MSAFTLFHTAASILPVGFGLAAFARRGAIDPETRLGKWYLGTMFVGTVTGFRFIATIGFTAGQVLGLFTLALLLGGLFTVRGEWRKPGYAQTAALTTSFLMLMVFATTETLKHFPAGQPFATSAADPALIPVRLGLLALYAVGLGGQLLKIRHERSLDARLERVVATYRHAA